MLGAVQQPQPQGLQAQVGRPEGAPHQIETLGVDAAETLYVDNMTMDVTRREMAHVFRPFEGFKVWPPVPWMTRTSQSCNIRGAFFEFLVGHRTDESA